MGSAYTVAVCSSVDSATSVLQPTVTMKDRKKSVWNNLIIVNMGRESKPA